MVEAQATETRDQIRARIKQSILATFESMDQYEVKVEEDDGNIEIRQSWDDAKNTMLNFGECKNCGDLIPSDFKAFMENWEAHGKDANQTLASLNKVGSDNGVDTFKLVVNVPWPLS